MDHAVAARIGQENGFLVYTIKVIDPDMKFHKLIIDPADGKVLLSRELTPMESMMMHFGMFHHGMMKQGMMEQGMMEQGMVNLGSPALYPLSEAGVGD